jgi:hypothetical protein
MGFFGDVLEVGGEVLSMGAEVTEVAGEATPFIGAGFNGAKAVSEASQAHDAELAGDKDKADFHGGEAAYDWLKAVPGVGTALGVAELTGGAVSGLQGHGFVHGMDEVKDMTKDVGAMVGIEEFGGGKYKGDPRTHDEWGSHAELREQDEDKERFAEAQKRADEAKAARAKGGE